LQTLLILDRFLQSAIGLQLKYSYFTDNKKPDQVWFFIVI